MHLPTASPISTQATQPLSRGNITWLIVWYAVSFLAADLWTESVDFESYVDFMESTMHLMTVTLVDGSVGWESDKGVLRRHFERRQPRYSSISCHLSPL